jgi:hypothetical protein
MPITRISTPFNYTEQQPGAKTVKIVGNRSNIIQTGTATFVSTEENTETIQEEQGVTLKENIYKKMGSLHVKRPIDRKFRQYMTADLKGVYGDMGPPTVKIIETPSVGGAGDGGFTGAVRKAAHDAKSSQRAKQPSR